MRFKTPNYHTELKSFRQPSDVYPECTEAHVEGAVQGAAGFSGVFLLPSIISFR